MKYYLRLFIRELSFMSKKLSRNIFTMFADKLEKKTLQAFSVKIRTRENFDEGFYLLQRFQHLKTKMVN